MNDQQRLDFEQPPDLKEQIAEIEREIATRRRVYPRWIELNKIDRRVAEYRIRVLEVVAESLDELREKRLTLELYESERDGGREL